MKSARVMKTEIEIDFARKDLSNERGAVLALTAIASGLLAIAEGIAELALAVKESGGQP